MKKKLDHDEVREVALLARLELCDKEVEEFATQLSSILGYIEKLDELDTDGVEPIAHSLPINNIFREDIPHECLSRDKALGNAPDTDDEFFMVPKILDDNTNG